MRAMRSTRLVLLLLALGAAPALAAGVTPRTYLFGGPTNQRFHHARLSAFLWVRKGHVREFSFYGAFHGDSKDCAQIDGQPTVVFPNAPIEHSAFRVVRVKTGSPKDFVRDLAGTFAGRVVTGSFTERLTVNDPRLHRNIHCTTGIVHYRATRRAVSKHK
jgi:hypothetical protein